MRDPRLSKLYSVRFAPDEKERIWQVLCRHFFQRYVDPQSTVLDIGAGYCEFINHIVCQRRIAFDLDEHVQVHAGPGVEVVKEASTDLRAFQNGAIDVVFASNFFERYVTGSSYRAAGSASSARRFGAAEIGGELRASWELVPRYPAARPLFYRPFLQGCAKSSTACTGNTRKLL